MCRTCHFISAQPVIVHWPTLLGICIPLTHCFNWIFGEWVIRCRLLYLTVIKNSLVGSGAPQPIGEPMQAKLVYSGPLRCIDRYSRTNYTSSGLLPLESYKTTASCHGDDPQPSQAAKTLDQFSKKNLTKRHILVCINWSKKMINYFTISQVLQFCKRPKQSISLFINTLTSRVVCVASSPKPVGHC